MRLKKDGYTVIGADWKRQEYFEEKEFCDEFHEVKSAGALAVIYRIHAQNIRWRDRDVKRRCA